MKSDGPLTVGLTGSRGVLGRSLMRHWQGCVWATFDGDVRSYESVASWFDSKKLDAVVHLAAVVPVREVETDFYRAFQVNVGGTLNLLEALRSRSEDRPWFFYASSSHVYRKGAKPIAEGDALEPSTLYGLTKLHGEQVAQAYSTMSDIDVCIGRIFSFGSPLQSPAYFLPSIVKRIRNAPSASVIHVPGASQKRDFLTTELISDAIRHLCLQRETGIVNIGSGKPAKIIDVARRVAEELGREDLDVVPADDTDEGGLVADISEIRSRGWHREFGLADLIGEMISDEPGSSS